MSNEQFRAGFVTFVGRPNVGKSTLTNALVGEKVAITSPKPQTTRRAIRGIVNRDRGQLIIVDTPGVHRPRTLLGERLNDVVTATLGDVDVICFCIPANEKLGPGDRFIHAELEKFPNAAKVAIVTKIDDASRDDTLLQLAQVDAMGDWAAVVPLSATTDQQLDVLVDVLLDLLPNSPKLYDDGQKTDDTDEQRIAELIREAALGGVSDELPHSIAVQIDEMIREDDEKLHIYATLVVERDSQKGIIIGAGGSRLKNVRSFARRAIRDLLGEPVALSLHVGVMKEWQRDPKALGKLGF